MYQHKIYGSDKDLLSVVFFGTENHNTTDEFTNIYVLQVSLILVKFFLLLKSFDKSRSWINQVLNG